MMLSVHRLPDSSCCRRQQISEAQKALHAHLDIAACVEAIQLVDNLKHSTLHLIVAAGTIVKACTT